jgi:transposase
VSVAAHTLTPALSREREREREREMPKRFGNWHTVYTRMRRWAKAGVLDKMFEELQREQVVRIRIEAVSLDSTSIKVHPDGTGALRKKDRKPSESPEAAGTPRFI